MPLPVIGTVDIEYDGVETITVTVSGYYPNEDVSVDTEWIGPGSQRGTTDSSGNLTLNFDLGSGNTDGTRFAVVVYDQDDGTPLNGQMFAVGNSGAVSADPGTSLTWDHTTGDVVVSYTPYGVDTEIYEWWDGGFSEDSGGTLSSQSYTHDFGEAAYGDFTFLQVDDPTYGEIITGLWWYYADSDTVFIPAPPANFKIVASPRTINAFIGLVKEQDVTFTATLVSGPDDTATVTLSLPSGVTAAPSTFTIDENGGTQVVHITADASVLPDGATAIPWAATDTDETIHGALQVIVSNVWCVAPPDVANTNNPDVFTGTDSNGVRYLISPQTQDTDYFGGGSKPYTPRLWGDSNLPAAVIIDGDNLPPPGRYTVDVTWAKKAAGDPPDLINPSIYPYYGGEYIFRRNGVTLWPVSNCYRSAFSSDAVLTITGPSTSSTGPGPTQIGVAEGDVLEIVFIDDNGGFGDFGPPGDHPPIKWSQVCFTRVDTTPAPPLGPHLETGQILGASVPFDWSTTTNISPEPNFVSGQNEDITMQDFCVMDNGDVYLAMATSGRHAGVNDNSVYLWKFDASSNTWSMISNDVWGRGNHWQGPDSLNHGLLYSYCYVDTDGDNVYILFGDIDGTKIGTQYNLYWHVVRYNIGDNTIHDDMGGVQGAIRSRAHSLSDTAGLDVSSAKVKVGPDGKVWVVWTENNDGETFLPIADFSVLESRIYVWYWGGSSWVKLPPPIPTTTPDAWQTNFVSDCLHADIAFRHHDGSSNWPCVFYVMGTYYNFASSPPANFQYVPNWVYMEYDGKEWSYCTQFFCDQIWAMGDPRGGRGTLGVGFWEWWCQGLSLVDDGSDLYLFGASGHTQYGDRGVVAKLKPDEPTPTSYVPTVPVVDSFSRHESPLSLRWSRFSDNAPLYDNGSQAMVDDTTFPTGSQGTYVWGGGEYDDVEVRFTLGQLDPVPAGALFGFMGWAGVILRASLDSSNEPSYYRLMAERGNFGSGFVDRINFGKVETFTQVQIFVRDYPPGTFQAGDEFAVQAMGWRFWIWYKPNGGSWTLIQDYSDWQYSSGQVGIQMNDEYADYTHSVFRGGSVGISAFAVAPFTANFYGFEALQPMATDHNGGGADYWCYTMGEDVESFFGNGASWENTVIADSDDQGNLVVTCDVDTITQYAVGVAIKSEYGTGDGWLMGPNEDTPIDQDDVGFMPYGFHVKDGVAYVAANVDIESANSTTYAGVVAYPINPGTKNAFLRTSWRPESGGNTGPGKRKGNPGDKHVVATWRAGG